MIWNKFYTDMAFLLCASFHGQKGQIALGQLLPTVNSFMFSKVTFEFEYIVT